MSKGRGRWALGATHLANSPSLQPSPMIQSAVLVAATITITVMKQQVKAITLSGLVTVMVSIVTCGAPILGLCIHLLPLDYKTLPNVDQAILVSGYSPRLDNDDLSSHGDLSLGLTPPSLSSPLPC